jgi:hypothetical protein
MIDNIRYVKFYKIYSVKKQEKLLRIHRLRAHPFRLIFAQPGKENIFTRTTMSLKQEI